MTEFETTTLAYQAAALSYQYAGLWVSGGVGAAQCLLIGFGLWVMHRAAERRDSQNAETVAARERRHAEYMANHEETMKVLNANVRGLDANMNALNANVNALNANVKGLEANVTALKQQGAALHAVIERTAPRNRN